MQEKAVIDLGTNTFHLLIFTGRDKGPITPILKRRVFVKLAEDGIGRIGDQAFERALAAMREFADMLRSRGILEVKAFGTAALRNANNAKSLVQSILDQSGIEVQVISGMQEAEYISHGVRAVWSEHTESALIMDIGGGSVEFILTEQEKLGWMVSLPIGVAVLHRDYHHSDQITSQEEARLRTFLSQELSVVSDELRQHSVTRLVGASGTFDVIADLFGKPPENYVEMDPLPIYGTLQEIIRMTAAEREAHPAIPTTRVDMIVVAAILVQEVLAMGHFEVVGISKYALKEGVALNF